MNGTTQSNVKMRQHRSRWAAIGAAVAVSIGAGGGYGLTQAAAGDPPVTSYVSLDEPCRLIDSRPAAQVGPFDDPIGAGETWTIPAHGECDIPDTADAVSINVTGLNATAVSFFTLWPDGTAMPTVSNLNLAPGQAPTPNLANVKIGPSGAISLFNAFGTANAIIDVSGYYVEETSPLLPRSSGNESTASGNLVPLAAPAVPPTFALTTTLTETPGAGQLIVNATATLGSNLSDVTVECSISPLPQVVDGTATRRWTSGDGGGSSTIAATRTIDITELTTQFAVYFTCKAADGLPVAAAVFSNPAISAIYIPGVDGTT